VAIVTERGLAQRHWIVTAYIARKWVEGKVERKR